MSYAVPFSIAAGLAALGGLLSFSGGAHAVPCNFAAIQIAADGATSGDIIHIDPGTCGGPVIVIKTDGITIEGSGTGVGGTILEPTGAFPIAFRLEADDVTFKDMTIREAKTGIRLQRVGPPVHNTEINNVKFGTERGMELHNATTVTDLRVIDSRFRGLGFGFGIFVGETSTVDGLTITNSTFNDYDIAVLQNLGGPSTLKNLHISRSTFKNNIISAITVDRISNSIVEHSSFLDNELDIFLINNPGESGVFADHFVIQDNVLMNTVDASIFLRADTGGIGEGGITIKNNTFIQAVGVMSSQNFGKIDVFISTDFDDGPVTILNNNISFFGTFAGGAGATAAYGIKLRGSLNNISIQGNQIDGGGVADGGGNPPLSGIFIDTNGGAVSGGPLVVNACNTIENFVNGVSVYDSANGVFGGLPAGVLVEINNNNINGNSGFGVNNADPSETIDAVSNWWGAATGPGGVEPGSGDAITNNVDFGPFLIAPCADGPNHFLLYDLVSAPGEAALSPLNIPVEISDQFDDFRGGPLDKIVGRPVFLANPASKNGEGVADASEHLVCYLINSGGGGPLNVDVLFSNQFTEEDVGRVKKPRLLCVPSNKEVLE